MNKTNRSGMTLVEVTVALAILAFVLGGIYQLIVQAGRLGRLARDHYVAVILAQNRIERAKVFDYRDLRLLAETNVLMNANGAPDLEGRFRRTTSINTNFAPNLTEVVCTVEIKDWRTAQFAGEGERVASLFTRYLEP